MIERTCETCGKRFLVYPSGIKRGQGVYCSRRCHDNRNGPRLIRSCQNCGKRFEESPAAVARGEGMYCSPECYHNRNGPQIEKLCKACGKEFLVYPSRIKLNGGIYCSKECYSETRSNLRTAKLCPTCGKSFQPTKRNGIYCSKECFGKRAIPTSHINKVCKLCGREFKAAPSEIKRGGGIYCSKECYNKRPHTRNARRYPDSQSLAQYREWRAAVLDRDRKCVRCGETKNSYLCAHHIKDVTKYPELHFSVGNGVILCIDCHALEHPSFSKLIKGSLKARTPISSRIRFCEHCGKAFLPSHKRIRFCSKECAYLAQRKKFPKICEECGKEFWVWESRLATSRFCSRKCHGARQKVACKQCGKEFSIYRHEIQIRHFCSKECASLAQRTRVPKICEECGKEYRARESALATSRFCSRKCKDAPQKVACKQCGKEFSVYRHEIQIRHFCSKECVAKANHARAVARKAAANTSLGA
jgi:membrane protease subunit (stomatin/prohibitin family)